MTSEQSSIPEEYKDHISPEKDWKEIVAWVGDLPPLPHVAARALSMIEDPDTTAGKLSQLLGGDTALAARVLKIANSAMFSRQREITTINQAVMTVGFKTLKGIIVAATLRQLNRKFGQVEKLIWQNSACSAIGARCLAQKLRKPYVDEAFLCGLLHDLGKLILNRQIPEDYKKVIDVTATGTTFVEAEQATFGYAHNLIGALVAKKWNFSLETCQLILHHHDPVAGPPKDEAEEKLLILKAANSVAHDLGFGHPEGYPDLREESLRFLGLLNIDAEEAPRLTERIAEEFSQQGDALM